MTGYDTPAGELLSDLGDFLTGVETVLHTASIDERIAIGNAAAVVYTDPTGEDPYTQIIIDVARLRERIYDYLEN